MHSNTAIAADNNIEHDIQGVMHGPSASTSPGSLIEIQIFQALTLESESTFNMIYS